MVRILDYNGRDADRTVTVATIAGLKAAVSRIRSQRLADPVAVAIDQAVDVMTIAATTEQPRSDA